MNDIHPLWGVFATFVILIAYHCFQIYRHNRRMNQQSTLEPTVKPLFQKEANGWVTVNESALLEIPGQPLEDVLFTFPEFAPFLEVVCEMQARDVYNAVFSNEISAQSPDGIAMLKRGLTVGSALFNYSIPESFVLLDHRTRELYRKFVRLSYERKTATQWQTDMAEFYQGQHQLISGLEVSILKLTKEDLLTFYQRHHAFVAQQLLEQSQYRIMPSVEGFMLVTQRRLGYTADDGNAAHKLRVITSVLCEITALEVPAHWVMCTALTDTLSESVLKKTPPPTKRHLTVVSKH